MSVNCSSSCQKSDLLLDCDGLPQVSKKKSYSTSESALKSDAAADNDRFESRQKTCTLDHFCKTSFLDESSDFISCQSETQSKSRPQKKPFKMKKEVEPFLCEICKDDISDLDVHQREVHLNLCIDQQISSSSAKSESPIGVEVTFVLECPLCFRHFPSPQVRASHIKKCGKSKGLGTQSVIKALELQERHAVERVALGLPIKPCKPLKSQKSSQRERKLIVEPKNKSESDLHLAKALSLSLENTNQDNQVVSGENGLSRTVLQAPTSDRQPGKKPSKHKINSIHLLALRSEEDRKRILQEKVMSIISTVETELHVIEPATPQKEAKQNEASLLWSLTGKNGKKSDYYLEHLLDWVEPSDGIEAKFLNLSQVPGHEIITQHPINFTFSSQHKNERSAPVPGHIRVEEEAPTSIIGSLKSLVASPWMSDVDILTACGSVIPAHRLILALRCPALKKDETFCSSTSKAKLKWDNISFDVALQFLNYLYSGEFEYSAAAVPDMLFLASKYEVSDLEMHLNAQQQGYSALHDNMQFQSSGNTNGPSKGVMLDKTCSLVSMESSSCLDLVYNYINSSLGPTQLSSSNPSSSRVEANNLSERSHSPVLLDDESSSEIDEKSSQEMHCPSSPDLFDADNDASNYELVDDSKSSLIGTAGSPSKMLLVSDKSNSSGDSVKVVETISSCVVKRKRSADTGDAAEDSTKFSCISVGDSLQRIHNCFKDSETKEKNHQSLDDEISVCYNNSEKIEKHNQSLGDGIRMSFNKAEMMEKNHHPLCDDINECFDNSETMEKHHQSSGDTIKMSFSNAEIIEKNHQSSDDDISLCYENGEVGNASFDHKSSNQTHSPNRKSDNVSYGTSPFRCQLSSAINDVSMCYKSKADKSSNQSPFKNDDLNKSINYQKVSEIQDNSICYKSGKYSIVECSSNSVSSKTLRCAIEKPLEYGNNAYKVLPCSSSSSEDEEEKEDVLRIFCESEKNKPLACSPSKLLLRKSSTCVVQNPTLWLMGDKTKISPIKTQALVANDDVIKISDESLDSNPNFDVGLAAQEKILYKEIRNDLNTTSKENTKATIIHNLLVISSDDDTLPPLSQRLKTKASCGSSDGGTGKCASKEALTKVKCSDPENDCHEDLTQSCSSSSLVPYLLDCARKNATPTSNIVIGDKHLSFADSVSPGTKQSFAVNSDESEPKNFCKNSANHDQNLLNAHQLSFESFYDFIITSNFESSESEHTPLDSSPKKTLNGISHSCSGFENNGKGTPKSKPGGNPSYHFSDSPITPLPDYKSMLTPEIKGALRKYGLKAMPRRKAIALLHCIYDETHPLFDGEREIPASSSAASSNQASKEDCPSKSRKRKNVQSTSKSSKKTASTASHQPELLQISESEESDSENSEAKRLGYIPEISFSQETQDSPTKIVADDLAQVKKHILSNDQLYTKILTYQPLNLLDFHHELKSNSIKISISKLMDFLDEQCITFTCPRKEEHKKKQTARANNFRKRMISKMSQPIS